MAISTTAPPRKVVRLLAEADSGTIQGLIDRLNELGVSTLQELKDRLDELDGNTEPPNGNPE